jgi:hypothetical protein|tara:strand:- start:190 stop:834 length:645 start_codon:yes stop_codon:yes gene_type:complete
MKKQSTLEIKTTGKLFPIISLLITNSLAIFGILFLNWSGSLILFSYWMENIIVGYFTVLKMRKAEKLHDDKPIHIKLNGLNVKNISSRTTLISFFCFHYGLFAFVHGIFILSFLSIGLFNLDFGSNTNFLINTLIFTTFLFISHQISYKKNFIGGKEYKNLAVSRALITPYRRVIPVHIAIMFGAISGIPGIILVSLKTIIDLLTHYMEHKSKS